MRWLELSVEADVEAVEAVSEILGRVSAGTAVTPTRLLRDPGDELAARPDTASPFVVTAHVAAGPTADAALEATERALWHLRAFGLGGIGAVAVRPVEDADWTQAWRAHYVPQRIGRVLIVPSWVEAPTGHDDAVVVLDPGMAFGTGLHPTTRGCLEMLGSISPMPADVLDVGCGSGILALAALKLGAARATAVDTDATAVRATLENASRNGLETQVTASEGTLPDAPARTFPLITANLVAAVLVSMAPRLASHLAPAGTLICGGIIEPRADEVIAAMSAAGLRVVERADRDEWVALRLEHAPT
jgi:ribosomal protein L11 methyltransferase